MFSTREISNVEKLIDSESSPHDVLEKDEESIVTNINLIRDSLFVPKQKRIVQTILLKKLVTLDFDFTKILGQLDSILHPPYELRIGLSFIAENTNNDLLYFFAIRQRPVNDNFRLIKDSSDMLKLTNFIGSFTNKDLLNFVFVQNNNLNAFDKSGFRPRKLVLASIWISKFADSSHFYDNDSESDDDESNDNDVFGEEM